MDYPFRISLKNSCNENLLKKGLTEVGKIKMQAEKEETQSKGFPENIIKFLRALNALVNISLKKTAIAN